MDAQGKATLDMVMAMQVDIVRRLRVLEQKIDGVEVPAVRLNQAQANLRLQPAPDTIVNNCGAPDPQC